MRIKRDDIEAAEEAKRKALEARNPDDSDVPESDDLGDESDKKTTLEEDMEACADFIVIDESGFSMQLLQGVPVKALFAFGEHRHKPGHEKEEALDLLDSI